MKFYVDYLTGTVKIDKEKEFYQSENLINKISVYLTNCSDPYFITLEFLLPNGRKTTMLTCDSFENGESDTMVEDGITYKMHHFSLSDIVLSAAGTLAFTAYINFTNPSTGAIIKRGVLFNGVNKVNKTVEYSSNSVIVLGDQENAGEIVTDVVSEILRLNALISSLSPYNRNTLKSIVQEIMEELYPDVSEEAM